MQTIETFVLSDMEYGEALPRFVAWLRERKGKRAPRDVRLVVRLLREDLPLALIWHRQQTLETPAWRLGLPILETRLERNCPLSGLLVWLATSCRRTIAPGTTVTVPHWLEYASPLHDRLVEAISRHVVFTGADAELHHGSEEYRRARAIMLLKPNGLIGAAELRRHFSSLPER